MNAARVHLGLDALPVPVVASYVGNGAPMLVRKALGPDANEEQVDYALTYFLSWYRDHMLEHTRPYPGVVETFDQSADGRNPMAVLTNKPERFSKSLLAGLDMAKYFFRVYGGNSFPEKKPSPFGLQRLMEEAGVRTARTWMIGDSSVDILTARNAGVRAVGVTYGIQPESLEANPPDLLLGQHVLELLPALESASARELRRRRPAAAWDNNSRDGRRRAVARTQTCLQG